MKGARKWIALGLAMSMLYSGSAIYAEQADTQPAIDMQQLEETTQQYTDRFIF